MDLKLSVVELSETASKETQNILLCFAAAPKASPRTRIAWVRLKTKAAN